MHSYNQGDRYPKHLGDYTQKDFDIMTPKQLVNIIKNFQAFDNFILQTDSYKMTHHLLLPEGMQEAYAYMEPRGGEMPYSVMFGLQYYIKKYLAGVRITPEKIEAARKMNIAHFGFDCFNDKMWYHIWEKHGGMLPLEIKAVPEGTPVAIKNVLMTIRNTDDKCSALTNITETLLLKLWAPNTIAAYARIVRTLIMKYHAMSSDAPQWLVNFMHHDFGYRGVSSEETARILGAAALSSGFVGTDTMGALVFCKEYYNEECAGFSVIASEHSVHCSYGARDKEPCSYKHIIEEVKRVCADVKPSSGVIILSLVSDTYNIYNVVKRIIPGLRSEFIGWTNNYGIPIKIVVRPDSGDPATVLFGYKQAESNTRKETVVELVNYEDPKSKEEIKTIETADRIAADMKITLLQAAELVDKGVLQILFDEFGFTTNSKGFRVLHSQVGVLQGDGVSYKMMQKMYRIMIFLKIDIMNVVFGSGGKYLQAHDRDEQGYATKVIHVIIDGNGMCVQKNPITDAGKKSKKGYLKLIRTGPTWKDYITLQQGDSGYDTAIDILVTVFLNGYLMVEYDFVDIRVNAQIHPSEYQFDIEEISKIVFTE